MKVDPLFVICNAVIGRPNVNKTNFDSHKVTKVPTLPLSILPYIPYIPYIR